MPKLRKWEAVKLEWAVLSYYQRFESLVALALTVVVVSIILVALYRLASGVIVGLLVGVLCSVLAVGFTLIGMNRGLEEFRANPKPIEIENLPSGVAIESRTFERKSVSIRTEQGIQSADVRNYWLLNALGSSVLPDGKYLYNPQSKQIEVQWIQGIGSERAAAPVPSAPPPARSSNARWAGSTSPAGKRCTIAGSANEISTAPSA